MPPVRHGKSAAKHPVTPCSEAPAPQASTLGIAAGIPQVKLFNKFMRMFINRVQAPVALAPAFKTTDDNDRSLKP